MEKDAKLTKDDFVYHVTRLSKGLDDGEDIERMVDLLGKSDLIARRPHEHTPGIPKYKCESIWFINR